MLCFKMNIFVTPFVQSLQQACNAKATRSRLGTHPGTESVPYPQYSIIIYGSSPCTPQRKADCSDLFLLCLSCVPNFTISPNLLISQLPHNDSFIT